MLIIIGNRKESGLLGNLEHRHILECQPFPSRSLEDCFHPKKSIMSRGSGLPENLEHEWEA